MDQPAVEGEWGPSASNATCVHKVLIYSRWFTGVRIIQTSVVSVVLRPEVEQAEAGMSTCDHPGTTISQYMQFRNTVYMEQIRKIGHTCSGLLFRDKFTILAHFLCLIFIPFLINTILFS